MLSETKHLHMQKTSTSIKRCVCREALVQCPVGLSLSCQDKARCPLTVKPSAHWCSVFLFKQRKSNPFSTQELTRAHWGLQSWSPQAIPARQASLERRRHDISLAHFWSSPSLCCSGLEEIKSRAVPGAVGPSAVPYVAPHFVSSIIVAQKAKLLQQTCIMRGLQKHTGDGRPVHNVSLKCADTVARSPSITCHR